jgi:hypothetical protein
LYIQSALKNNETTLLKGEFIREMVARQMIIDNKNASGLGLFIEGEGTDLTFQHKGQDEGFITNLYALANKSQGTVIMINNDAAWGLMQEVTNSIADVYGWPNFIPKERKNATVDPELFNIFSGLYYHESEEIELIRQGDRLFIDLKNGFGRLIELHPENHYTYFMQEADIQIKFLSDDTNELIMIDSNNESVLYKRKS